MQDDKLLNLTGNPLSLLWQSISHSLVNNYHVYFLLPAFLESFAVAKLMKQHSVNLAFSVLIFFSIGTYITYVAALKQCFAMFFLLMSIPYAEEKKYVDFYKLPALFTGIALYTVMYCGLNWLFTVNAYEKEMILGQMKRKRYKKI